MTIFAGLWHNYKETETKISFNDGAENVWTCPTGAIADFGEVSVEFQRNVPPPEESTFRHLPVKRLPSEVQEYTLPSDAPVRAIGIAQPFAGDNHINFVVDRKGTHIDFCKADQALLYNGVWRLTTKNRDGQIIAQIDLPILGGTPSKPSKPVPAE